MAIKHVFPNHTVLQFQCTNTVQEQVLEDVRVAIDLTDAVRLTPTISDQHKQRNASCAVVCSSKHDDCCILIIIALTRQLLQQKQLFQALFRIIMLSLDSECRAALHKLLC